MGILDFLKKKDTTDIKSEYIKQESNLPLRSDLDEFTSEKEEQEFTKLVGDEYVTQKQLNLTDEELDRMSITDGAEMWRLYSWFKTRVIPDDTKEKMEESHKKIDRLAAALVKKVLEADEIYCLYNKKTGEPHLFSNTIKQDGGYLCTPPEIRIFTKAYAMCAGKKYPNSIFEMKKVAKGVDGKGIEQFFGSCFYLNGARGIELHSEQAAIDASMIVPSPDFTGMQEISIPIMNPDLMRWMLLMAQMSTPETDDEKLIYGLYHRFMSKEIVKARFLTPMKKGEGFPAPDDSGEIILKKDATFGIATMKGKYDRDAVIMYTDWKRLGERYAGWDGSIMTLEGMIGVMDAVINPTDHPQLGFYIGRDMYEDIKKSEKS